MCLWMNYFKEMNEVEHDVRMSQAEIENVILNLHNDKSSGLDNVTNEYFIKYCVFYDSNIF